MSKASKTPTPRKATSKRARTTVDTSDLPEMRNWSGAVRGRFFTGGQTVLKPVFVDSEVMAFLTAQAKTARKGPDELANDLLHRDIDLIRAAGG